MIRNTMREGAGDLPGALVVSLPTPVAACHSGGVMFEGINRRTLLGLAAAAVVTTVVGCSDPGSEPPPRRPSVVMPDEDVTRAEPKDLRVGAGELRLQLRGLPSTWNPLHSDGPRASQTPIISAVMPQYFHFSARAEPTANPDYLVEAVASEDATQVRFELNPDAVWGDGAPLTSEDWVATWRAMSGQLGDVRRRTGLGWERITEVRADGATGVEFSFDAPFPAWPGLLRTPLRASAIGNSGAFNEGWSELAPAMQAGPFQVAQVTEDRVVLSPNMRWWGIEPALLRVTFKVMDDEDAAAAYSTNEIDVLEIDTDTQALTRAREVNNGTIRRAAGQTARQLLLNTASPQLADVAVRLAVLRSIDRDEIAVSDLSGLEPVTAHGNTIFTANQTGYVDHSELARFDPEAAGLELDAAGLARGADGVRTLNGQPWKLRVLLPEGDPLAENEGLQLQRMLSEAGAEVELVTEPEPRVRERLASGEFELAARLRTVDAMPTATVAARFDDGGDLAATALQHEGLAAELEALRQAPTLADQAAAANRADEILWREGACAPLYSAPQLVGVRQTVVNIGAMGFATVDWTQVGYTG
ncbi:hypothetical protein CGZ92_01030 [Parenemella sanctibonifatiensis]|uniref:Solute-binding protein family 5 domain-containing protein n=2 Tax=Parenemella sanctibonifatiensis TaxID=2016505 RepID=A0A255EGU0_9ACTN|nr:hypothetical protein CGZ92_01030 [Parenemella sanctibonifatiensis]